MLPQDFSALTAARHSTRDFLPDPLADCVLDAILADATTAPSWSNTRPYMLALADGERAQRMQAIYATEFEKVLDKTADAPDGDYPVMAPYPEDLRPRSISLGMSLYAHMGIERGDREARNEATRRNFRAFGAPVMGFVLVHEGLLPFSAVDAGLMLQTLFLSAKAHGVDSCPLGFLATWRSPLDSEFEIPQQYKLVTGFALGYASDAPVNDFRAERPAIALAQPRN